MKNKKCDKIEKYCKYCEKASSLSDEEKMLCSKHGVVSSGYACRDFCYDPLKRAPKKMASEIKLEYIEV